MYKLLKERVKLEPEKIGLICDDVSLSYNEFEKQIKSLGEEIKKEGISDGEKVGIITENPIEFAKMFFAVSYCNAIIIPIYLKTGCDKIKHILEYFEIKHVLTNEESVIEFLGNKYTQKRMQFGENYSLYSNEELHKDSAISGIKLILFSSGTTNMPKAVMLSEKNILSNIEAINDYLKLNSNDKILLIKNLNHASSIVGEFLLGIYVGACIVFTRKLVKPNTILRLIESNSVTMLFAIPFILDNLFKYKKIEKYDLSSLKKVNFYGGNFQHDKILELIKRYPQINFIYSYGLTEASPRVTAIESNKLLLKEGSCGKAIKGVKITIRDVNNNLVGVKEEGEIVIEGPNVMKGYYKNPCMTQKTIIDGLLHTGDLGYLDSEGYLYVTGRKDNMFIIAGKNVHPEEIENIINNHPAVIASLVKKEDNEKIKAYVKLDEINDKYVMEIYGLCKKYLEYYKIPSEIVIVDDFERTVSGKIVRRRLKNSKLSQNWQ